MNDELIIKQLEENTAALKELREAVDRTSRYVKWLRIWDVVKILLIVIPLIAAYLYLPSFLDKILSAYGDFLPASLLR
jgi:hypothetical protein